MEYPSVDDFEGKNSWCLNSVICCEVVYCSWLFVHSKQCLPLQRKARLLCPCFVNSEVFSYLQSHQHLDILVSSKSSYYETLAKHPVHDSNFVLLYVHRSARWIFNSHSSSRVHRKLFLQLAIRASWSLHLLAQTSFQLAPEAFWQAQLILWRKNTKVKNAASITKESQICSKWKFKEKSIRQPAFLEFVDDLGTRFLFEFFNVRPRACFYLEFGPCLLFQFKVLLQLRVDDLKFSVGDNVIIQIS